MKKILFLIGIALSACSTQQKQIADFAGTPAGQSIISAVENAVSAAATNAAQQAATGKVNGKKVALASLSSVSQQLRSLQSTGKAADPNAITAAVQAGSASPAVTQIVAPTVATIVAGAVSQHISPDAANEAAAIGLDKAAAKK